MVWSVFKKSASPLPEAIAAPPLPQTPSPFLSSGPAIQRPSLKSASRHSRTAPRPSKSTQEWPKSSPRAAQSAPRPPQDRPKTRLKAILKPYHIFRSYWTRKSSETFIFKWFGAFFKNSPALSPRRPRHPLSPRPPLLFN